MALLFPQHTLLELTKTSFVSLCQNSSIAVYSARSIGGKPCATIYNCPFRRLALGAARPRRRGDRMSNCHLVAARPLIDLVASRLALRAPALRAATALTRPNRSAQRLPCGRRAAPTAVTVDPSRTVAEHGVERGDHLTHHRHDDDLRLLSGGLEAIVECFEPRIPITSAQRRHVEHVADARTTAPDATAPFELAAIEIIGCKPYESGNLLAAHLAELGQERDQRASQHGAYPWHGGEQAETMGESRIGGNDLDQALVKQVDVGGKPSDAAARKALQHRTFQQSGRILGGDFVITELAPDSKHRGELFDHRRLPLRRPRWHDGDERCDHPRIKPIVLGQSPTGLSELPQLERIDLAHRHASREQSPDDTTLVATTCLDADRCDRGAAQLLDQFGPAGGVIAHPRALLVGQHHDVQAILRHVDTTEREHCHLRIPSLLMRARARATVRVWKKRLELQAHSRFGIRSACGLPVATGRRS